MSLQLNLTPSSSKEFDDKKKMQRIYDDREKMQQKIGVRILRNQD